MASGNSKPVLGYPSKSAAAVALEAQGLTHAQIAEKIDSTELSVKVLIRDYRKKLALAATNTPPATPGQWTEDKKAKVRRLYGLTLIEIAKAVQVPPAELLRFVIHGIEPPRKGISAPEDFDWREDRGLLLAGPATPEPEPEPPYTPPPLYYPRQADGSEGGPIVPQADEAEREDDEAELARLEAEAAAQSEQPAPPDPAPKKNGLAATGPFSLAPAGAGKAAARFRLSNGAGEYLHESGSGMTRKLQHAWFGTNAQLQAVLKQKPKLRELEVEPLP